MRTFSPQSFAQFLPDHFKDVARSAQVGQAGAVSQIKAHVIALASGPGAPKGAYRRGGIPIRTGRMSSRNLNLTINVLPINKITGELLKSLRVFHHASGGKSYWQIQFTSPHAQVTRPGGLKYMKDRHFWETVNNAAGPVLQREITKAIRDTQS